MRLPHAFQESIYLQAKRHSGAFTFLATLYKDENNSFQINVDKWREGTEPTKCHRNEYEGYVDWEPIN